jgi:hypothetical protein
MRLLRKAPYKYLDRGRAARKLVSEQPLDKLDEQPIVRRTLTAHPLPLPAFYGVRTMTVEMKREAMSVGLCSGSEAMTA